MNDKQLLRYSRHILLPQIDVSGQEKLSQSHVLIIGLGGLGSPAALYLAASGVSKLTICDPDKVDLTNLQRQIIHDTNTVGLAKTSSAQQTIKRINPEVTVVAHQIHATGDELSRLVSTADVVIDGSDNFETRHNVNKACIQHKKPLVSGAVIRFEGQITVFDQRLPNSPCYHCLFPLDSYNNDDDMNCANMGVFSPLAGIIGCMQAAETIKLLLNLGQSLHGRLQILDGLSMTWRQIKLNKDPGCNACASPSCLTNRTAR